MATQYKGKRTIKRGTQGFTTTIDFDFTVIKTLLTNLNKVNNRHIKVGWYERKKHPKSGFLIATLARMHEFGYETELNGKKVPIPARPYFRQAYPQIGKALQKGSVDVFKALINNKDFESHIEKIGYNAKQAFQLSVMKQNMRKLSEYTVAKKGHAFQWDDTGMMLHHFKYKVFKSSMTKASRQAKSSGK